MSDTPRNTDPDGPTEREPIGAQPVEPQDAAAPPADAQDADDSQDDQEQAYQPVSSFEHASSSDQPLVPATAEDYRAPAPEEPPALVDEVQQQPAAVDDTRHEPPALVEPPASEPARAPAEIPDAVGPEPQAPPVDVAPAQPTPVEPVVATADPGAVATQSPAQPHTPQIVYVREPTPPKAKGNRLFGTLLALGATLVFAALLALVIAAIYSTVRDGVVFDFLARPPFYVPVIAFFVAFVLLVLIVNRAGWWAHVLGSLVVALLVYVVTIGVILLGLGVTAMTPAEAGDALFELLTRPELVAALLLAREVALWTGAAIAARGRRVKARNAAARDEFERERAEARHRPAY